MLRQQASLFGGAYAVVNWKRRIEQLVEERGVTMIGTNSDGETRVVLGRKRLLDEAIRCQSIELSPGRDTAGCSSEPLAGLRTRCRDQLRDGPIIDQTPALRRMDTFPHL